MNWFKNRLPSSYPRLLSAASEAVQLKNVLYQKLFYARTTVLCALATVVFLVQTMFNITQAFGQASVVAQKIDDVAISFVQMCLMFGLTAYFGKTSESIRQWLDDHPYEGPERDEVELEMEWHEQLARWWGEACVYCSGLFVGTSVAMLLFVADLWFATTVVLLGVAFAVSLMKRNRHRRLAQSSGPVPSSGSRSHLRLVE